VQVELMSYTSRPEDTIVERYLLEQGVPISLDNAVILRKVEQTSSRFLKDILFHFFIADVPREMLAAFPRYRDSAYTGYRELSRDAPVKVAASMDALELLEFFRRNICSRQGIQPNALVYAMLAAARLACPHLFSELAVPCPAGTCEIEKAGCRHAAREWSKRIQKLIRISGEAFAASKPNYTMTFDFTEVLGYPVVLTVRKS
jgi:hypothetical protein